MDYAFELIGWWSLAIVKFLLTPSTMMLVGKGAVETYLVSVSGAWLGYGIFSFFGKRLFSYLSEQAKRKGKRVFTKSRRRIVHIKHTYGLWGLAAISGIISVPISTLLSVKYFHHERFRTPVMLTGFAAWGVLLTFIAWLVAGR